MLSEILGPISTSWGAHIFSDGIASAASPTFLNQARGIAPVVWLLVGVVALVGVAVVPLALTSIV